MASTPELADFLAETKAKYLSAVQDGSAINWVVVMGNEAGDLDTIASSVGFAWFTSQIQGKLSVPLIQTSRADLHLRAENEHALSLAGLKNDLQELLCLSDLPLDPNAPFPSREFALVDHNRINQRYVKGREDGQVVAIVDHHDDEKHHQDADPRIIEPAGSAASLVARVLYHECPDKVPASLAKLLLSSTIIDTNGLKPGGKATPADNDAAGFLYTVAFPNGDSLTSTPINDVGDIVQLNHKLQSTKSDVSRLGTRDLLRRDYKDYNFTPTTYVGLASVPIGFQEWFNTPRGEKGKFWKEAVEWMEEENLDALGVLTSFRDSGHMTKKGNPKHRREQLWLVRKSTEGLAEKLFEGLKKNKELELKEAKLDDFGSSLPEDFDSKWESRLYKQKNANATRKITAPIVRAIVSPSADGPGKL